MPISSSVNFCLSESENLEKELQKSKRLNETASPASPALCVKLLASPLASPLFNGEAVGEAVTRLLAKLAKQYLHFFQYCFQN